MTTPATPAHTCSTPSNKHCPACDLLELRNAVNRAGIGQGSLDRLAARIAELETERRGLADTWARYQRRDLDREEFEGFVAEMAER